MPWISRRAQAETAAAMTRLRDRCRDLETELAEQGRANGRLAARAVAAETAHQGATKAVRAAHRSRNDEIGRLCQEIDRLRVDRDGLRRQLDDALGYTAADAARLDAGAIKPA